MAKFMRLFKNKHKSENNKENERFSDTFSEDDRRTVHFNDYTDEEMINPYHATSQTRKYPKGPQSCPGGVQDNNRKESKRARGHPHNYFDELHSRGSSSHHKQRAVNKYSDDEESENQRHRTERKMENLKRENSSLHEKCQRLEEELERARKTSSRLRRERNDYRERCHNQRYMGGYMGGCCQPHFAPAPTGHFYSNYNQVPSVFNDTPSTSSHNSVMRGGPNHGSSFLYPRESLSDLEMNHRKGIASNRTLSHNESEDDENFLQPLKLNCRSSQLSGDEAGFSSAPTLTISDQKHKRPQ